MRFDGCHKGPGIRQGLPSDLTIYADHFTIVVRLTAVKSQAEGTREFTGEHPSFYKFSIKEGQCSTVLSLFSTVRSYLSNRIDTLNLR